ncbi:hypothetical protein J5N97_001455 [Dioscorea zingiberensis]|uniref:Disease resistance R13L4/SHOC-2-like LRR domain-containing protein n=1 Tax=Dioscorea zingiberensis TaxID=325984 RepID=A0A9D5BTZ6_9LILI|nr:hypothetical protein J5N97_001455 [Dioscorea zingiberensis]
MGSISHLRLLPLLLSFIAATAGAQQPIQIPPEEQEAVYLALESINPMLQWRTLYPDDLCLYGPHGVVCELFPDSSGAPTISHVTELNFGYVSDFSSNPPCGPNAILPSSLSSLPFLRKIFFFSCFTGEKTTLSRSFWNLSSSLEEFIVIENPSLSGKLNGNLGNFPQLRRVVISGTEISGNIPGEIGNLRNLEQMVLSRNRLHGEIPTSIGHCAALKILDLSANRIAGRFPAEIGRLTDLVKLDLSANHITGPVPADLSRLHQLELLDLSHNRLTGGVPTALAEMVSLKEVYLSGNPLGGRIPEIWSNLKGILGIGMSCSGLVGNIPSSMGVFLENVCYLSLSNNFLEGELPEQFKQLESSAKEINFENNALRGRIPFSAPFIQRIGGKLKLGGNPKLCLGEELAFFSFSSPAVMACGGSCSPLRTQASDSEQEDAAAAFGLDDPPDPPFVFFRLACFGIAGKSPLRGSLPPLLTDAAESLFGRLRRDSSDVSSMAPADWFRRERRGTDPSVAPRCGALLIPISARIFISSYSSNNQTVLVC